METLTLYLNNYTNEGIQILIAVLLFVCTVLIAYWLHNRRKFRELSHQIPASVVKNYLDTIITNSTALKSSLFRGGGLDLGEGIPSVVPTSALPSGGVSVDSGASSEELAQKNAEIAQLKSTIGEKENTIAELEKLLAAARESNGGGISDAEADVMKNEITDLKGQLEKAKADLAAAQEAGGGGGDPEDSAKLDAVTKERDELKDRLMEYEIIEEDLANLKRFQQENEELKKTIEQLKGGAPAAEEPAAEEAPVEEPAAEEPAAEEPPAEEPAAEEPPEEVTAEENPAADDAATEAASEEMPEVPTNEGEQKSAEELLSEFEKMLG